MTLNTSTLETNLTTKMNNTTGTTEGKEFLLLGKAVEALTPTVTVNSVINEGTTQVGLVNTAGTTQVAAVNTAGTTQVSLVNTEGTTQVAAVQAAGSGYAPLTGATFTGDIDMGSNDITTTGKVLYSNVYSTTGDLPSASTYHGMFAHVHGTGKGYFAHGGNWIELASFDTSGNLTVAGNLTVSGTTTTVNSTTLDVADLNITIANGAADAAAASGAGITVDGASATMLYTSATDTWDFNKSITGTYTNLQPVVDAAIANGSTSFSLKKPMHHITMSGNSSLNPQHTGVGRTTMLVIDRASSGYFLSFGNAIHWPDDTEPTWADHRYWVVSVTCFTASKIFASATGHTV